MPKCWLILDVYFFLLKKKAIRKLSNQIIIFTNENKRSNQSLQCMYFCFGQQKETTNLSPAEEEIMALIKQHGAKDILRKLQSAF